MSVTIDFMEKGALTPIFSEHYIAPMSDNMAEIGCVCSEGLRSRLDKDHFFEFATEVEEMMIAMILGGKEAAVLIQIMAMSSYLDARRDEPSYYDTLVQTHEFEKACLMALQTKSFPS